MCSLQVGKYFFILTIIVIFIQLFGCGGSGGNGSGSQATIPDVTLEKSSATAASILKVSGLDIEACPLSTSEIRVGGETAPALLNDKGEVVMLLPLFYDETTKWSVPPSGPQDVEIYCNGTLLTTLPDAMTVTELQPAPGTTEAIVADYTQIINDFEEIVAVLAPDPGIQQQLLTSYIAAIKDLLNGTSVNSLPAVISELTQDNPEILALLDAAHAATGVNKTIGEFKELMAELKIDVVTAPSLALTYSPAAPKLSVNTSPAAPFTSSLASSSSPYIVALPDEALARQMQIYSTLKIFSEQVISATSETFSGLASVVGIALNVRQAAIADVILKTVDYAFKILLLSPFPATLEPIELVVPKTTLKNSEITYTIMYVYANNIPAPTTFTDIVNGALNAMGLVDAVKGSTTKWVNSFKEMMQNIFLVLTSKADAALKDYSATYPDIAYDVDLFTVIPPIRFEASGYTRELYTLYPLEGGGDSKIIHPLTDKLEWQADATHWGKATIFLETVPLAFGDAMTTSNRVPMKVGELILVLEHNFVKVPEGESISVGVKLSNPPPEDQFILVNAQHTNGDNDIYVTSQHPLPFDDSSWDTYQSIVLAAAEDEDQDNGQATITVSADVDLYGEGYITIEDKIIAQEEDKDESSFVTSTSTVNVPEGTSVSFRVKLKQEPPSSINVSVSHAGGDNDISVQSGSLLVFNDSNWDTYQTVELYAQPDEDTDNGTAHIKISTNTPDLYDKFVTAVEQEISEESLAIQGSQGEVWGGQTWSGVVAPLTFEPHGGCQETVKGTGSLEYVGYDYWYETSGEVMCHATETGYIDVIADGIKDCLSYSGNPPGYTMEIKLYLTNTGYWTCSDGNSGSFDQYTGFLFEAYFVALNPQNDYIGIYEDTVFSHRVELLQPPQQP